MAEAPKITLNYWGGRGLMEVPRLMMAISGKFAGEGYTDVRVTTTADRGNSLDNNLGRVPLCETPDGSIGQSAAINFYIASECGLMGSTPFEAAQIINFCEHLKELGTAFREAVPYGKEPTPEGVAKFFDPNDATDFEGPADGAKRPSRALLWYMGRLERLVGDGFAIGGKLSLADVALFNMFADTLPEAGHEQLPVWRREPFTSLERTQAALQAHPRLNACIQSVANHENTKKWMETRGVQGF